MSRGKAHAGSRLSRRAESRPRVTRKGVSTGRRRSAHSGAVPSLRSHRNPMLKAHAQMTTATTLGPPAVAGSAVAGSAASGGPVSMTTAEATVAALVAHGLDTIYALPGVHNDALFDALFKASDRIRTVHSRHEQGAAYMALGAALATGRTQAYSVVPGPGLLNSSAALLTAYGTNAPVLALIGHIPQAAIGRMLGHLHEIRDQTGIIERLVDHYARIHTPAQAPGLVAAAIASMRSGRP